MNHLLNYTFEIQSLIFFAVFVAFIFAFKKFPLGKLIIEAYKQRSHPDYIIHRYKIHTQATRYILIGLMLFLSLFKVFHVQYWPLVVAPFFGLIIGATINYLRERYIMMKSGKKANGEPINPVDLNDVLHGAIGGMEGSTIGLIGALIIYLVIR